MNRMIAHGPVDRADEAAQPRNTRRAALGETPTVAKVAMSRSRRQVSRTPVWAFPPVANLLVRTALALQPRADLLVLPRTPATSWGHRCGRPDTLYSTLDAGTTGRGSVLIVRIGGGGACASQRADQTVSVGVGIDFGAGLGCGSLDLRPPGSLVEPLPRLLTEAWRSRPQINPLRLGAQVLRSAVGERRASNESI